MQKNFNFQNNYKIKAIPSFLYACKGLSVELSSLSCLFTRESLPNKKAPSNDEALIKLF